MSAGRRAFAASMFVGRQTLDILVNMLSSVLLVVCIACHQACGKAEQHERALSLLEEMRSEGMNLRRTGEKLWWVFNTCRDKKVKERAWALMEVEQTRERVRLRAERNAQKAAAEEEAAAAVPLRRTTTPTV